MTREEFMDLLRYYFRNINQTQVNEIPVSYTHLAEKSGTEEVHHGLISG